MPYIIITAPSIVSKARIDMNAFTIEEKQIIQNLGATVEDHNMGGRETKFTVRKVLDKLDWEGYRVVGQSANEKGHIWTLYKD